MGGTQAGSGGAENTGGSNGGSNNGGSSAAGGSGATGGADDDYNPCPPAGTPCVIMPFGDSLTQGDHGNNTADGSYRPRLFHLALEDSHSVTFVGQASNGPDLVDGVAFPKNHDGFPGYSIDGGGPFPGITSFAAEHIATYQPHIVTLMIGTNDVASEIDLENAPTRLGNLLDVILDADPELLLVVAQITPSKYDDAYDARVASYNAAIPPLVEARASAGKHIRMVDMYSAFLDNPEYKNEYFGDNVHCSNAGYDAMGDVWFEEIGLLFR
jgi:lysophospholipase L1-like esterase